MTALAVAAAAVLIVCELTARRGASVPARRLERYVARRPARSRRSGGVLRRVDRRLVRIQIIALIEQRLREAGVPCAVSEALLAAAAGAAAAGGAAAAFGGPPAACAVALVLCPGVAWLVLGAARDRRCRRLDLQLPAALDLLVGQLRGHRSAAEGVAEIARRLPGPLRAECARVSEETALGASLSEALERLRRRVPSPSLGTIVTAILVAERSGGNLAECLSRQSQAVREHLAFLQEVRAVTAHARGTATVLTLFPVGVAAAMLLLDPTAMDVLVASRAGRTLLGVAGALQIVGWYAIRTMIRGVTR
ncbi:MAG TPA: type II secretion system F family protein [bacterium]|nr:type II secretion system F family protein [bacterium]